MLEANSSRQIGDHDLIRNLLRRISNSWLSKEFDALRELFHEKMVIVHPGFQERAEGRDSCIQSYRTFGENAVVEDYEESDRQIDICGSSAAATYHFDITYQMGGRVFRETGRDLVVLTLEGQQWQVVWRTLILLSKDVRERNITV